MRFVFVADGYRYKQGVKADDYRNEENMTIFHFFVVVARFFGISEVFSSSNLLKFSKKTER